ncbi:chloramphenicol O-acetyltransferase type A [Clostridium punense]|uniref:Chloramphenicol O-acetyltransferase type A n=1 Tax=Clostridium punense TaxID=1054297 RepID=A0ABS4K5D1_9CLOT|nr:MULTISPECIES: chloramphenicol acetyltransferase [Clostridium]EQB89531.1 chloramphenicol acetyltransferase [Clostridium sp. BL8]MBP2022988.1 chloramphenicol O-acetyltransferase type A [Clostridium punense]
MKYIDIENWKRKDHYNYFKQLDYPHFSICGNLDISNFYKYIIEKELPFFISLLYTATKTANSIKEFRFRIREDKVIEHEIVSPSFTVMAQEEVFSFCTSNFTEEFKRFKNNTLNEIEKVKNNISIEDEPGRDDLLYVTSVPWVTFTSITHPIHMKPVDSIPRISWGKYFEEGGKIKLPLSVQAHHALVDGIHVGQFFNAFQEILNNPSEYL